MLRLLLYLYAGFVLGVMTRTWWINREKKKLRDKLNAGQKALAEMYLGKKPVTVTDEDLHIAAVRQEVTEEMTSDDMACEPTYPIKTGDIVWIDGRRFVVLDEGLIEPLEVHVPPTVPSASVLKPTDILQ